MADWSQSAAGLGQVFGKFMSGQDKFDDGMLSGAKIRQEQAAATAAERKNGYVQQAMDAGLRGDLTRANVFATYGGAGKSSFDAAPNGTVFNTVTGGYDESSKMAQGYLGDMLQRTATSGAQAALDRARANEVNAKLSYEQDLLRAQAQNAYANAYQTRELTPYEAMTRTAQAQNNFANAYQTRELTPYEAMTRTAQAQNNFANAYQTRELTPYEQALKAGQIQGAFSGAEVNRAQVLKYLTDVQAAQAEMGMGGGAPLDQPPGPGFVTNRAVDAMGMIPGMQFAAGSLREQLNAGAGKAPPEAVQMLMANNTPEMQAAFRQKYGYLPRSE